MNTSIVCSWAFMATIFSAGCGSSSSGGAASCGAGTVVVNGTCVPQCGPGTTLMKGTCVAANGGTGGSSVGGSSGSSGGMSSGGTGTTSAGGTMSSGGANAGTSGASGTGTSGAAGKATGGSGGGATGGSGPLPPCPDHIDLNCDLACGPVAQECTAPKGVCAGQYASAKPAPIDAFVIRTPPHPGTSAVCFKSCGGTDVWALAVQLGDGSPSDPWWRMRTDSPDWWAVLKVDNPAGCVPAAPTVTCVTATESDGSPPFFIVTTNPNAPAANVVIEHSPTELTCP